MEEWRDDYVYGLEATVARQLELLKRCGKILAIVDNLDPDITLGLYDLLDDLADHLYELEGE